MPRNITTGVFTRVSNSFSNPVYGTVIDPTDADSLFDDYDGGLTFNDTEPLQLVGSTSGVLTILAPDTASGTITLPAGTTDFSATGGTGQFVRQDSAGAPFTVTTVPASEISSGAALTKTDDTNVTLSLSGTPASALLKAVQLVLGWTGLLSVARGGTGLASGTSGGVLGYTASGTLASSAELASHGVVVGGGAGATPATIAAGTNGQILAGVTGSNPAMVAMSGDATIANTGALTIANNAVTNAKSAQMGAATLKGNPTAGTANATDFTIQGLTTLAAPSATLDFIPIYDHVTGEIQKALPGSIATGGFANPSASVGLTAVNGVASTAMRSDAAPALSQSIAPTWTGLHTYSAGGVLLSGNLPLTQTFIGGGVSALMWMNTEGTCTSATIPEVGHQVHVTSNVGSANPTTAYKIAESATMSANTNNSAHAYIRNDILDLTGTSSTFFGTGYEIDINIPATISYGAGSFGTTSAMYGMVSVASGVGQMTANYWACGNHTNGAFAGYAVTSNFIGANGAGFFDASNSANVILVNGTHSTGFNAFSATLTNIVVGPNNAPIGFANNLANATVNALNVDANNKVRLSNGTATIAFDGGLLSTGSAPTLTGFGTGASISGNNSAGVLTVGTGAGGSGTITFNADHPYSAAPVVIFCPTNGGSNVAFTRTNTAITVTAISDGGIYHYWVIEK